MQERLDSASIGHSMAGGDTGRMLDVTALEACPAGQVTTNNLVVLCHTTLTLNALVALEPQANLEYLGLFGFEMIELLNKNE